MVDYGGLTEDELAAQRERERLRELAALTDADLEAYGSDRSELAVETTSEPSRGIREVVEEPDVAVIEFDRKIEINKTGNLVLTYGDIEGITPDPVYRADRTIFKMNCAVEKIPAPKVNRVLGLNFMPKNIVTKGSVDTIMTADSDGDLTVETDYPTNFAKHTGQTITITIPGDLGASYNLVVKDITNTKWYNWDNQEFESGYKEKQGIIDQQAIQLVIPSQFDENKYHIFFKNIGSTIYEQNYESSTPNLPTEDEPWVIYQMKQATTTFRFKNTDEFIPEASTSITRTPLAMFEENEINSGKIDISMTLVSKRGKIEPVDYAQEVGESYSLSERAFMSVSNVEDKTELTTSSLTTNISSDQSTATISGTVTIRKSSLRDSTFELDPTKYFKIAQ